MSSQISLLDRVQPFIEKMLLTPTGVGFAMILIGTIIRMTKAPAWSEVQKLPPGVYGPPQTINHPAIMGLDVVVFEIDTTAFSTVLNELTPQGAGGPGLFWNSPIAQLLHLKNPWASNSGIMPGQQVPSKLQVTLSEILVFGGAAAIGGSVLSTITSAIPK